MFFFPLTSTVLSPQFLWDRLYYFDLTLCYDVPTIFKSYQRMWYFIKDERVVSVLIVFVIDNLSSVFVHILSDTFFHLSVFNSVDFSRERSQKKVTLWLMEKRTLITEFLIELSQIVSFVVFFFLIKDVKYTVLTYIIISNKMKW